PVEVLLAGRAPYPSDVSLLPSASLRRGTLSTPGVGGRCLSVAVLVLAIAVEGPLDRLLPIKTASPSAMNKLNPPIKALVYDRRRLICCLSESTDTATGCRRGAGADGSDPGRSIEDVNGGTRAAAGICGTSEDESLKEVESTD